MRYWAMDAGQAERFLKLRRVDGEPPLEGYVEQRGHGADYPSATVVTIRRELLALRSQFPDELKQRDPEGGRYEALACEVVHRSLPKDAQAMSDSGFWTWLAVTQLPEIVEWRHGSTGRHAALENYGIGNRVENLFFRMWLRAEIGRDENGDDPYWLAKRGDQDLWRSHILRQSYANVRDVARALVKLQSDDHGARLTTNGIRELAKRLKRLRANIFFEFLDAVRISGIVDRKSVV